jgi:hypothetical protein
VYLYIHDAALRDSHQLTRCPTGGSSAHFWRSSPSYIERAIPFRGKNIFILVVGFEVFTAVVLVVDFITSTLAARKN